MCSEPAEANYLSHWSINRQMYQNHRNGHIALNPLSHIYIYIYVYIQSSYIHRALYKYILRYSYIRRRATLSELEQTWVAAHQRSSSQRSEPLAADVEAGRGSSAPRLDDPPAANGDWVTLHDGVVESNCVWFPAERSSLIASAYSWQDCSLW